MKNRLKKGFSDEKHTLKSDESKSSRENNSYEDFNPLNDFLFSKYMGDENREKILLAFINAILEEFKEKIDSLKILHNKVLPKKSRRSKSMHRRFKSYHRP